MFHNQFFLYYNTTYSCSTTHYTPRAIWACLAKIQIKIDYASIFPFFFPQLIKNHPPPHPPPEGSERGCLPGILY